MEAFGGLFGGFVAGQVAGATQPAESACSDNIPDFKRPELSDDNCGNIAVGEDALANLTTGSHNVAIGTSAGHNLTSGSFSVEIGHSALVPERRCQAKGCCKDLDTENGDHVIIGPLAMCYSCFLKKMLS